MSNRLDQERELRLQPKRIESDLKGLQELGIEILDVNNTTIKFMWKGSECRLYPYSGWHCGKTINDGRGFKNLLKQLIQK